MDRNLRPTTTVLALRTMGVQQMPTTIIKARGFDAKLTRRGTGR